MDQTHRDILKKKRVDIVDNIANPHEVVDALFAGGILTDDLKEQIQAQQTTRDKVRKILDIVPTRGTRAFNVFYDTLCQTQNRDVADLLKPDLVDSRPRVAEPAVSGAAKQIEKLPDVWPLEHDLDQRVAVKLCDNTSHIVKQYWQSEEVYSMRKIIRGRCVIVSNKTFKKPKLERRGTDKDVEKLTELFKQLHFDVIIHKNKKAEEMKKVLKLESQHSSHRTAECFVLIICSHGTKFGVYGTDEETVEHQEILATFNSQNCSSLAAKPKLIFLQACHGDERDAGGAADGKTSASKLSGKAGVAKQAGIENAFKKLNLRNSLGGAVADSIYVEPDGKMPETNPTYSDFLVARATHPGFAAFRHEEMGSWFLQAVVWVLQRYAHDRDIHQLLTLVNNLVSKGRVKIPGRPHEVMQAARIDYSLRKTFYFFPGMVS